MTSPNFISLGFLENKKAFFVGGKGGVFAAWKEGTIVHLLAGDDGAWWEIGVYHQDWLPEIIKTLKEFS